MPAFASASRHRPGPASHADERVRALLAEIETWREALARNVALRNPRLSQRELNFAVQRTIDRIIFLRICEDRGIEVYGTLQSLRNGPQTYARLFERFRRADERYNSGLFHFERERGRPEAPDELTPALTIDDKPLKDILGRLYYPQSPYEFSVLPADILGHVYEQFLGKVIRLTGGHRAVVETKPEVRKAGGVYYTPTYIVDYIVRHTVGKLVEDKTPQQVGALTASFQPSRARGARPLAVLDPACGSGSFLLGAYQFLLNWYRDWYVAHEPPSHAAGRSPRLFQHASGEWRLTLAERKRILLSHIYGVDIDPQAVEVTKLSLLLKVLEGETAENLDAGLRLFHERALPDLAANIKCGNSLIGPDLYDHQPLDLFDEDERLRLNVFDWNTEFKDIMAAGSSPAESNGGFDAVIGNPPYLSYSGRQAAPLDARLRAYLGTRYPEGSWRTAHGLFVIRAFELSRRCVSFIVPGQVGHLDGYAGIRAAVTGRSALAEVKYWGEAVFRGVVSPAMTFVADTTHRGPAALASWDAADAVFRPRGDAPWLLRGPHQTLLNKLRTQSAPLPTSFGDPGVHTGNCSKQLLRPADEPTADAVAVLEGRQVSRYACATPSKLLRLGYRPADGEYFTLRPRHRYADAAFVIRQTAAYPIVGPRRHAVYFRNSLLALYPPTDGRDVRFVVAVLNSRLMRYAYAASVHEAGQRAFPQVKVRSLRALPIRAIDLADPREKAVHDALASATDRMRDLHHRRGCAATPRGRAALTRRIDALDAEIDRAVYALYGLTDDEIAAVEAFLNGVRRPALQGGRAD